jgi:hypothetical protein
VIWLVIAQSFFFSGYAILINGKPQKPELEAIYHALVIIFPIAALLTVAFTCIDVYQSIRYMKDLRKFYENSDKGSDRSAVAYPPIMGIPRQRIWMHASPVLIPLMFIITWVAIIVIQYSQAGVQ